MGRQLNKLTALKVKNLKFEDSSSNKHTDGAGLYLYAHKNGSKYWRMDYTSPITGKRNTLALGVYPTITLEAARKRRDEIRQQIANNIDPAEMREQVKQQAKANAENSFRHIAKQWLELREHEGKKDAENIRRLEKDVYPFIGDMPINQLTTTLLENEVIHRIIDRKALELARKVSISIKMVLEYARKKKLILINPANDITQPKPIRGNFAAITESHSLTPLLQSVWDESNTKITFVTRCAIKISIFIFLRPTEIRTLKWSEYNKERGTLTIQPSKQSNDQPKSVLIIPLAKQVVEILDELHKLTGHTEYMFYSNRGKEPYISEGTVNEAIKRIGFRGEQTAHGFRATARTILEEQLNFEPAWIERQLAHKVRDANGESYNRTKHVDNRRIMLQTWADHIVGLKQI